MSTVTKLGVYGLAVAAAFAVAFAVLVTAPRSSPVDAQTATDNTPAPDVVIEAFTEAGGITVADDGDESNDIAAFGAPSATPTKRAGDSVYIQVTDLGVGDGDADPPEAGSTSTLFRFSVNAASDAEGTFKVGGGTSLNCADNRPGCDLDSDTDDIIVQFDIDDGARANTSVVIDVVNVNDNKTVRVVISITGTVLSPSKLQVDLSTSLSRTADGIEADATTEAQFNVRLLDNQPTPADYVGAKVLMTVSPRGVIRTNGADPGCRTVTVCNITTDSDGFWVHVRGTGQPGPTTLTIVAGGFTVTREITFYGEAKEITAEAEQSSVQLGGSVFVVVTVTDGAGNGIEDRRPTVGSGTDRVQPPSDNTNPVVAVNNQEKDVAGTTNDLPACSDGTNNKGKCVVQVTATNEDGTANDAERGTHTVTIVGAAPIATADRKVTVEITVAGAVAEVTTNAPGRVDPGSTTTIVATVVDDEGVRAGAQSVTVTQVAGDGVLRSGGPATSRNGQHTFSYRAASSVGAAEFDVEVRALSADGSATDTGKVLASASFTIQVGEEEPEPPPEPEAPSGPAFTPGVAGTTLQFANFRGGSISDLQGALLEECSNRGVVAFATTAGGFVGFIPSSRLSAPNAAFRALFPDDAVPDGQILLVVNCAGS